MYHIKEDQRAIRSSKMIYDGLAKLMAEKEFATITVTDLVEAAHVGRTTFYRCFDEIEDVLRMRCDQVVEEMVKYLQTYRQAHSDESPAATLKPVLRYFYLNSELVELLMKAKRIHIFEDAFCDHVAPFRTMFAEFYGIEETYVDYVVTMRIGGVTNILVHWIATGKKQAPDDLADTLASIAMNVVALEQL